MDTNNYKSNNVEITGWAVSAILEGSGVFRNKIMKIFSNNGIIDFAPSNWYPRDAFVNSLQDIALFIGPHTLYLIGRTIHETALFPDSLDTLEKGLASIDTAHAMNHRGSGKIGNYLLQKDKDDNLSMVCTGPYPCEFDRGIIEGVAVKCNHLDKPVRIFHDDSNGCRDVGGASCTYLIKQEG